MNIEFETLSKDEMWVWGDSTPRLVGALVCDGSEWSFTTGSDDIGFTASDLRQISDKLDELNSKQQEGGMSQILEAYLAVVEMAARLGVERIDQLPGCWEHTVNDEWAISFNGHTEPVHNKIKHLGYGFAHWLSVQTTGITSRSLIPTDQHFRVLFWG